MTSTMKYHKNKTLIHLLLDTPQEDRQMQNVRLDKPHRILDTFKMPTTKERNKYGFKRLENHMSDQITIVPHFLYIGVLK